MSQRQRAAPHQFPAPVRTGDAAVTTTRRWCATQFLKWQTCSERRKIMNTVTSFVTIVSLLLALALAGSPSNQSPAYEPAPTRSTTSGVPRPCEDWGCGTNHNETLVIEATR